MIEHVYSHLIAFLKHPLPEVRSEQSFTEKIKIFIYLFGMEVAIILILQVLIWSLADTDQIENKVETFMKDSPEWLLFLFLALLFPVIEEVIFRMHLRINPKFLHLNIIILSLVLLMTLMSLQIPQALKIMILVLSLLAITFYFLLRPEINKIIIRLWDHYYPAVFYLTAVVFGLVHITNYNMETTPFLLLPILVLPQLLLGIFCGYARVKLGFGWACFLHCSHNLFFLTPFLFVQ